MARSWAALLVLGVLLVAGVAHAQELTVTATSPLPDSMRGGLFEQVDYVVRQLPGGWGGLLTSIGVVATGIYSQIKGKRWFHLGPLRIAVDVTIRGEKGPIDFRQVKIGTVSVPVEVLEDASDSNDPTPESRTPVSTRRVIVPPPSRRH